MDKPDLDTENDADLDPLNATGKDKQHLMTSTSDDGDDNTSLRLSRGGAKDTNASPMYVTTGDAASDIDEADLHNEQPQFIDSEDGQMQLVQIRLADTNELTWVKLLTGD